MVRLFAKRFEGLVGGLFLSGYVPYAGGVASASRSELRLLYAVAAVELRKAVLVVDVRGGDDVSGEQLRFVIIPF